MEVLIETTPDGKMFFFIKEGDNRIAEMEGEIKEDILTVNHTEVQPQAEGKGYAKKLLAAMVEHARNNHLKVVPVCPYVQAQFKRNENMYADICKKK
jgi:predicted GNAT family acetyltransferase